MKEGGKGARDGLILAAIVFLGLGGIAAYGFYQDEFSAFTRLQGWNLGPVKAVTREFLEAASKGDAARVESFIAPTPTMEPVHEGGKLRGIKVPAYGGPQEKRLKQIAPSAEAVLGEPRLISLDGGKVVISARYPNSHHMELSWDRKESGWKLIDLNWSETE